VQTGVWDDKTIRVENVKEARLGRMSRRKKLAGRPQADAEIHFSLERLWIKN
jgi:hypothetical protein